MEVQLASWPTKTSHDEKVLVLLSHQLNGIGPAAGKATLGSHTLTAGTPQQQPPFVDFEPKPTTTKHETDPPPLAHRASHETIYHDAQITYATTTTCLAHLLTLASSAPTPVLIPRVPPPRFVHRRARPSESLLAVQEKTMPRSRSMLSSLPLPSSRMPWPTLRRT